LRSLKAGEALIPLWLDKIHQGLSAIASLGKSNFIGVAGCNLAAICGKTKKVGS